MKKFSEYLNEVDSRSMLDTFQNDKPSFGSPMSRLPASGDQSDYGKFDPKNFNRYKFNRLSEQEALKAVNELKNIFYSELPYKLSILSGFYRNDEILKVYDEFLSNLLTRAGVKV